MSFWNGRLVKVFVEGLIVLAVGVGAYVFVPRQSDREETEHLMPEVEKSYVASLDDIRFAEMQMWAVVTDMDRYLGWYSDEKDLIKKASVRAGSDLKEVERYLKAVQFSGKLAQLRDMQLVILHLMAKFYDGIESRNDADCAAMTVDLKGIYSKYSEKLAAMTKGMVPEVESLEAYMAAAGEPNDKKWDTVDPEKELVIMERVLDSGKYSPMLAKTYIDWRTKTQLYWHGASNMSEIPNWEYNLKRWQIIKTIRQHLKANPSDSVAARQAEMLLALENIGRGGPFGNNVLNYVADPNL